MNNAVPSSLEQHVEDLCRRSVPAKRALALSSNAMRRSALKHAAEMIVAAEAAILSANERDLEQGRSDGLTPALLDRLKLDGKRLAGMVRDLGAIADLPDPVGKVLEDRAIAQGVNMQKIAVPIGVVVIIFESRPNVTIDAAALCLRSGNACILRGGKEAMHSNWALATAFRAGIAKAGLPADAVQLVTQQDRALVPLLLARDDALDLVVPRGGEDLIKAVVKCSKVPVIKHDKGVCSLYVHERADVSMALSLVVNAKCQRPGVCNAIENLLVDAAIADLFLPLLSREMAKHGVELRADERALRLLPGAIPADEEDWSTEYLALILAVKIVDGLEDAIAFTGRYGSHHSDGIVTADTVAAERYLAEVDSACVYHNASTRFTDGAQFLLGAEVGISTNRMHARGPMGLAELCTYKYVCRGNGQVRS